MVVVKCERVAGGRCLLEVAMVECERVAGGRCLLLWLSVRGWQVGGACWK